MVALKSVIRHFYIDVRSLVAFRIGLALVLLYDLGTRAVDLTAHYTNDGVLPIPTLLQYEWNPYYWSLNVLDGSLHVQALVFAIAALAALLLLLNIKPRWMLLVCWVGLVSIQNRNPLVLQGGDDLLRMMTFWAFFLPWHQAQRHHQVSNQRSDISTVAILLQVLFVFQFAVFYKGSFEWWEQGSALYYAYSLDQMVKPLGLVIKEHYELTKLFTRIAYATEWLVFPLFFIPVYRPFFRGLIVVLLIGFNLVTANTLVLGVYPLAFMASALLFIPSEFWNRLPLALPKFRLPYRLRASGPLLPLVQRGAVLIFLVMITIWNIAILPRTRLTIPQAVEPLMYTLRLNQSWGMFAPNVFKEDGWMVLQAQLYNCDTVDINNPTLQLAYDKPANVFERLRNDRWRKYTEQMYMKRSAPLLDKYSKYLVHKWNKANPAAAKQIEQLDIIYLMEFSVPWGAQHTLRPILLYQWPQNSINLALEPAGQLIDKSKVRD